MSTTTDVHLTLQELSENDKSLVTELSEWVSDPNLKHYDYTEQVRDKLISLKIMDLVRNVSSVSRM